MQKWKKDGFWQGWAKSTHGRSRAFFSVLFQQRNDLFSFCFWLGSLNDCPLFNDTKDLSLATKMERNTHFLPLLKHLLWWTDKSHPKHSPDSELQINSGRCHRPLLVFGSHETSVGFSFPFYFFPWKFSLRLTLILIKAFVFQTPISHFT